MNDMEDFLKITEQASEYHHLEKMSVLEILSHINEEDQTVPFAVAEAVPQIESLCRLLLTKC